MGFSCIRHGVYEAEFPFPKSCAYCKMEEDAVKAERERIIHLLSNGGDFWLCILSKGNFAPLGRKRIKEALDPRGL